MKQGKSTNQSTSVDGVNGSKIAETSHNGEVTMETKLPRKQSVVWVAMKSVKTKLSLTEKGATPVNWKIVFLVFISLFSSSFTLTFLFPFLPEMIKSFGYKEEEKGYYAGIVASAMFAGRACGSYFWGWLSDRKGRRLVMLITILLNGVVSLAFGFTTGIVYAFITRFLTGLVNGTVVTAKTVLYEISDNTNQAVGMSIISVAWGIGIILGPTVGGYLANPCKRYPDTFPPEGLFYDFPYIIPGASAFAICLLAFVVDFIWLPETLNMKNEELEINVTSGENIPLEPSVSETCDPSSIYGSRNYLSEAKASISMEDIHCESEGATFLAKTGKEIHLTRHGLEFADVKDNENENKTKDSRDVEAGQVERKHTDQSGKNLFLNSKANAVDTSSDHNDICTHGCEAKCDVEDSKNNAIKGNIDMKTVLVDKSGKSIIMKQEAYSNNIHVQNKGDLDSAESVKLLRSGEKHEGTDQEEMDISKEGRRRDCHILHMIRDLSVVKLLSQSDVFLVTTLYSVYSFSVIGVEEIFTVWCSTDTLYDGLGFQPNEIGAVLGSSSIPLLLFQFILFPNLVRRFGAKKTFLGCSIFNVICMSVMPTFHLVRHPTTLWVLLVGNTFVMKQMTSCIFSATSLFINNSVTPDFAGSVNGLTMTATAITRSIAPLAGGALFSWTVSYSSENIGPPFDISFTFFMFGLILWMLAVWGITIPERLNKQKK